MLNQDRLWPNNKRWQKLLKLVKKSPPQKISFFFDHRWSSKIDFWSTRPTRSVMSTIFPQISVRISQNIAKQNKRRVKIMITTGGTVGLSEGIIDDTCILYFFFSSHFFPFILAILTSLPLEVEVFCKVTHRAT